MIKYLVVIAFLVGMIGLYYYMVQKPKIENIVLESMVSEREAPFISSDKFAGKKEGYVFKMDSEGLGYYLDNRE